MEFKNYLFERLVKEGYSERSDGRRVWDIASRAFLYFSDDMAQAFLNLRSHPRYKATIMSSEIGLLNSAADKYKGCLSGMPSNLIDLGCGDGKKAKVLIENLGGKGKLRYVPVNVNRKLVDLAVKNIKEGNYPNVVEYEPMYLDLNSLRDIIEKLEGEKYRKNVVLLLGNLLASFDIHQYLFELSNGMKKGDCLLIGNAIRSGDRFSNIENYLHPSFVEWVSPLITYLGFGKGDTEYKTRFENARAECYFEVKKDKLLEYGGKKFDFKKGDEVLGLIIYKYYADELEKFCKMYFRDAELIKDSDGEHALVFCKK